MELPLAAPAVGRFLTCKRNNRNAGRNQVHVIHRWALILGIMHLKGGLVLHLAFKRTSGVRLWGAVPRVPPICWGEFPYIADQFTSLMTLAMRHKQCPSPLFVKSQLHQPECQIRHPLEESCWGHCRVQSDPLSTNLFKNWVHLTLENLKRQTIEHSQIHTNTIRSRAIENPPKLMIFHVVRGTYS